MNFWPLALRFRQLQPVGENVIAVESHERIAVDQQRPDASGGGHVQGDVPHDRIARVAPKDNCRGGHEQFEINAGGGGGDPLPFRGKTPGGGHVDERQRREDHQQHARRRNRAAEVDAGDGVRGFVQNFQDEPDDGQSQPVVAIEQD